MCVCTLDIIAQLVDCVNMCYIRSPGLWLYYKHYNHLNKMPSKKAETDEKGS